MTLAAPAGSFGAPDTNPRLSRELDAIVRAPEWINSSRLTADDLRGKIVLANFWTYTCINWLRTLPYVRAWARTYQRDLLVIGVHTPEFGFEHDVANVRRAVAARDIPYPVVIDNDYAIWRAFKNQYWPATYLVDARGRVREHFFGEGDYERSEAAIQRLLNDAGSPVARERRAVVEGRGVEAPADWANVKSPETYVGYERAERFASGAGFDPDRRRSFKAPGRLGLNQWALTGEWSIGRQVTALHTPGGRLAYRFHARDLHLVMGPARGGAAIRYRVALDGRAPGAAHGIDVDEGGGGTIEEPRLYQLIRQQTPVADRTFEIEFLDAGAEVLAFTFG